MPPTIDAATDALGATALEESQPRYIAIEGPIGAGKSTLAHLLAERFGASLVQERFEENPFLGQFYNDRRRLAFQTQIFFLLSRYRQQQEIYQTDLFYESVVSDYLFAKDRIFANINLNEDELKLYDQIESALQKTIPIPDVVIYLQCGVGRLEENIKKRGRIYERGITREYLLDIVQAYNDYFFHFRDTRLIVVNASQIDFLSSPGQLDHLLSTLRRNPHPPVEYLTPAHDELFGGTTV